MRRVVHSLGPRDCRTFDFLFHDTIATLQDGFGVTFFLIVINFLRLGKSQEQEQACMVGLRTGYKSERVWGSPHGSDYWEECFHWEDCQLGCLCCGKPVSRRVESAHVFEG